jgi:L-threonylcarbamoyladenylate synthase
MSIVGFGRDWMKDHLNSGGLIVYPTSTLPGLGCLPTKSGLNNLFSKKNRLDSMPVSLGVASLEQVKTLVHIPGFLTNLLDNFPKGGITTILPSINLLDERLGGGQIAIRVFSHPAAIELANEFGPITATSANKSGSEPEENTEDAAKELGLAYVIPGICPNGLGSTYINLVKDDAENRGWRLTVMREGVVPREDVVEWWTNRT